MSVDTLRQRKQAAGTATETHAVKQVAGKTISTNTSGTVDYADVSPTFTPPSFTIKDLLGAIPKECYERSAIKSSAYLLGDLLMLATFAYLASHIDGAFAYTNGSVLSGVPGRLARIALWAVYAFCAGSVGTGVWVIAHECGHQAYSPSKTINNTVGWIFHSLLLVPYHSWRISHARHHAATVSMERDEVFVPKTRTQAGYASAHQAVAPPSGSESNAQTTYEAVDDLLEDAPLWNLIQLLVQQLLGWPMYLFANVSGQKYGRWTNHFDPEAPIFDKRHFAQVLMSDLGIGLTFAALTIWGMNRGFAEVAKYYIIPYIIVNHHLVMITFLQHTDPMLPHYRKSEWTFAKGAICTVDRSLGGPIGNFILHGICDTHVAHHVCSKIPHYNGVKATNALKDLLGEHYLYNPEPMYLSLWKNFKNCKFVEDTGSCVFYKNKKGVAARTVVYETDSGAALSDDSSSGEEPDMEVEA